MRLVPVVTVIAVSLVCSAQAYEYTVEILPLRPSWGQRTARYSQINNAGIVVGDVNTAQNQIDSFVWHSGSFTRYRVGDAPRTVAQAINDLGHISGHVTLAPGQGERGFIYRNGQFILPSGPQGQEMSVYNLNNQGDYIGYMVTGGEAEVGPYAVVDGQLHVIPLSGRSLGGSLQVISNQQLAIGSNTDYNRGIITFSWTVGGGVVERPFETYLSDVNDLGEFVGYYYPEINEHAFLERSGQMIDLGRGEAKHINNRSEIVMAINRRSYLWKDGQSRLVDSLVGPTDPFDFLSVADLNDRGQMLVYLTYNDRPYAERYRAAILTPVPEPSTLAGLGTLATLLAVRRRGRHRMTTE